ncbi:hypothetical protein GF325_01195 [Candidatus Bathyarchaeota archaeon]|nr:hypothetical protein [Candidatus Bathyarchaeota archaeon]
MKIDDARNDEQPGSRVEKPNPIVVKITNTGGWVIDASMNEELHERGYFGIVDRNSELLFLHPEEIMVFSERNRLIGFLNETTSQIKELLPELYQKWEEDGYDSFAGDDRILSFEALTKHYSEHIEDFWDMYVVYRDLKSRGYIARRGIEEIAHFRVYKKGARKGEDAVKFIFFGVFEGKPIPIVKLHEISEYAMKNRQELILATVDRLSDITYYSLKKQVL